MFSCHSMKQGLRHLYEVRAETQSEMCRNRQRDRGQQYSYCAAKNTNAVACFQGEYAGRRVLEMTSMDIRTPYNIPMLTLTGIFMCDSLPRNSNMPVVTRPSAGSIRWPCAPDDPTLLRGNS